MEFHGEARPFSELERAEALLQTVADEECEDDGEEPSDNAEELADRPPGRGGDDAQLIRLADDKPDAADLRELDVRAPGVDVDNVDAGCLKTAILLQPVWDVVKGTDVDRKNM